MKKTTAILLVLAMVLSFGSISALAADPLALPDPVDGVITLTGDTALAATDEFNGDLTLDLAGYTLTGEVYVSGGTLTVKDSSAAQTGKITRPETAYANAVTVSSAKLVLESGTIEMSGQDSAGVMVQRGATAELKGGAISVKGLGCYGVSVMGKPGTVTVSGTEITAEGQGASGIYLMGGGHTANVTDGSITVNGSGSGYGIQAIVFTSGHNINISGGTIAVSGAKTYAVYLETENNLTVSGGTLKSADDAAILFFQGSNTGAITGGTIEGKTYGVYIPNSATNALTVSGDAVLSGGTGSIIAGGSRYKATPAVTISGGYFNGAVVGGVPSDKTDNYAIYDITGGYFTEPIADSALYNYALAKDYTPETYTDEVKAGETNKLQTVSVEKDGVTYGYRIGQPQPGYVLMNIPYDAFFSAQGVDGVDAVSSATLKTYNQTMAAGSYHEGYAAVEPLSDAKILGVTYPVYLEDLADLAAYTQVTDETAATISVAAGKSGLTTKDVTGVDVLFASGDYAYYVMQDTPNLYMTATKTDDGFTFTGPDAEAESASFDSASMSYGGHHADVTITVADAANLTNDAKIFGVILTADGKEYALQHVVNLWRKSEVGWNWDGVDGTGLSGKTITNLKYYIFDGGAYRVLSYDVDLFVKQNAEAISAAFDDAKTVTLTGLPEDIENPVAKVASKVGRGETPVVIAENAKVEDGKVTCTDAAADGTTYTVTVTSDNYADLTAEALYEQKACPGDETCPSAAFVDVDRSEESWSHAAIDWAVVQKITSGMDETHFAPDSNCTRAQAVTFLWRAAGSPTPASESCDFVDVAKDAYYYDAVLWAVENDITKGTDATHFSPDDTCTRAHIVTFLFRAEKGEAGTENPFVDVPDGAWYTEAVLWAVENGVTMGVDDTHFAPMTDCTRAQIVTLLYRADA
ncbi:MAG: S-layer homology domain-containing protein [Oscillospiraceae bacterium]|nr:S-layer homology domain-containing protein [Oscillospiraceae bacterium]